jgi:hypothetical protein
VPAGGTAGLAAKSDPARVTIAYEPAQAAVSATRIDFPSTAPGAVSSSRMLELTNMATTTDLVLSGVSLDSDEFVIGRSTCPGILPPGARCRIALRFTPSAAGARRATLHIASNADPLAVALGGDGAAPLPAGPPAATEPVGSPAPAPAAAAAAAVVQARTTRPMTRVTCVKKRCTVAFTGKAPKLTVATRVRATLTRSGRVYASANRIARRGALRLVLRPHRAVKPGTSYTLTLRIGPKRTTYLVATGR